MARPYLQYCVADRQEERLTNKSLLSRNDHSRADFWTAIIDTIAITCVISIIVINGRILGFAIVQVDIGRGVSRFSDQ
jgi:hypothetical protein